MTTEQPPHIDTGDIDSYIAWMESQVKTLPNYRSTEGLVQAAMLMTTHQSLWQVFGKVLQATRGYPENIEKREQHRLRTERLASIYETIVIHQVKHSLKLTHHYFPPAKMKMTPAAPVPEVSAIPEDGVTSTNLAWVERATEALHYLETHGGNILQAMNEAKANPANQDDESYWLHELKALAQVFTKTGIPESGWLIPTTPMTN